MSIEVELGLAGCAGSGGVVVAVQAVGVAAGTSLHRIVVEVVVHAVTLVRSFVHLAVPVC